MKFNAVWILNVLADTTRRTEKQNIVRTPAVTRYLRNPHLSGGTRTGPQAVQVLPLGTLQLGHILVRHPVWCSGREFGG